MRRVLHALAAIALCAGVFADEPARQPTRSDFEEGVTVQRVIWPIFVTPKRKSNLAVCQALDPARVRVTEDGAEVAVASLDRERRPTLHALLIDTSGSMEAKSKLHKAREVAKQYVDQLLPQDSIMVFSFDDNLILRAPLTRATGQPAKETVKTAIDRITTSQGPTFLRDAMNQLVMHVETFPERKLIIALTDGADTMSHLGPTRVLGTAASTPRQDVTIYAIGIGIPAWAGAFVKELAEVTGGEYFGISRAAEIKNAFQAVRERLERESYLSWSPLPYGAGAKDSDEADYVFRKLVIKSLDKRCKIDNPREHRMVSRRPLGRPEPLGLDRIQPLPAVRPLPLGRHWNSSGEQPFSMMVSAHAMRGRFVDLINERQVTHPSGLVYWTDMPESDMYTVREFEVLVPDFDRLIDGALSRPEDTLVYLIRNEIDAPREIGRDRSPQLVHGATFLELREALAESLYAYYPRYRAWAQEQLRSTLDRHLRYRFPNQDEPMIQRLVNARLSQPSSQEVGLHLATWLGDIRVRELTLALERRVANMLLAAPDDTSTLQLVKQVDERWSDLRHWFPARTPVRLQTPLVPVLDPERDEIGFYRVLLPRSNGATESDMPPRRPAALSIISDWLRSDTIRPDLSGWRIETIDYRDHEYPLAPVKGADGEMIEPEPVVIHAVHMDFVRDTSRAAIAIAIDPRRERVFCVQAAAGLPALDRVLATLELPTCASRVEQATSHKVGLREVIEREQTEQGLSAQ